MSDLATQYLVAIIDTMKTSIYSKPYEKLREWLKEQRGKDEKNTLRKLGEELDIHYSTLHKIEHGRRKIDLVEYVRYCKAMDVDPHEGIDVIIKHLD